MFASIYIGVTVAQTRYPQRAEKGFMSHETGAVDSCEHLCRFWEPNPGPL